MSVKFGNLPTEADYYFKARLKKITVPRRVWSESEKAWQGHAPVDVVILIPEPSTGTERFLSAWLPLEKAESNEVAIFLNSPIYMPARASVHRPSLWCKYPYLLLMGEEATKDAYKYSGELAEVKVFSEKEYLKHIEETTAPSPEAVYFSKLLRGENPDKIPDVPA